MVKWGCLVRVEEGDTMESLCTAWEHSKQEQPLNDKCCGAWWDAVAEWAGGIHSPVAC